MDVHSRTGLNIQRLRRERGISQEALALRAHVTRGYLSALEGGRRNPTIQLLEKLAKALDADIEELFAHPSRRAPTRADQ